MTARPVDATAGSTVTAQAKPLKPQVATAPSPSSKASPATSTPSAAGSVRISAAALAALKEATETPAQTAQEARSGDRAAQHLMAKAAAKAAEFKK
jgi:hypothetical protein